MAAVPVYQSSTTGTGTTTVVINKPASTVQNDLLIAVVLVDVQAVAGFAWSTPSGWSLVETGSATSTSTVAAVFSKVAGGSEPSSYTFTSTGGTKPTSGRIHRITGAATVTPIDSHIASGGGASTNHSIGSISPTLANSLIVEVALDGDSAAHSYSCTNVSSFTEAYVDATINQLRFAYGTSTASGSATASYTSTNSTIWWGAALSVSPLNTVTPSLFGSTFGFFTPTNLKSILPAAISMLFTILSPTTSNSDSRWTRTQKSSNSWTTTNKS